MENKPRFSGRLSSHKVRLCVSGNQFLASLAKSWISRKKILGPIVSPGGTRKNPPGPRCCLCEGLVSAGYFEQVFLEALSGHGFGGSVGGTEAVHGGASGPHRLTLP